MEWGRNYAAPSFMHASEALQRLMRMPFATVLDIGSGDGQHAAVLRANGRHVTTINLFAPADIVGDFCVEPVGAFDCLWASHVLEHQCDVGAFLRKCYASLNDIGILAVTVPPAKHNIVGGHLTVWNAGLLLYNLIVAGFDCAQASVKTCGYNVSVIVRKKPAQLPILKMDCGDIEALAEFFPFHVTQGFDGQIAEWNW